MRIIHLPRTAGTWPDGEPQSVRDAANQDARLHSYDVHMVVLGGYDAYEVIAVFSDRETARQRARDYNDVFVSADDGIEDHARVEEISFYPAGVIPQPYLP
jgi:hypothetical protein